MTATQAEGGFGADITKSQFTRLAVSLCLGTLVEWYDFTVYSQLSNVITALFFPPKNPEIAEISFWAVYAVGYIARPLGALIFGHVGDTHGRRLTLLISVLMITLPTLLIGCLPTYAMIGLAAPILMAFLRFVQGIAVGGEFGSAITYLFEMAPVGRKGFIASFGQVAVSPGMILGILMCQAVLYGCTTDQLMLWGWRVPFLLTVFTTPLAVYLRLHMPEPYEFLQDKQQMVAQRVASTAAIRVARSFTARQQSAALSSTQQDSRSKLFALQPLSSFRRTSSAKPAPMPAHSFPAGSDQHSAAAADSTKDIEHFVVSPRQSGAGAPGLRQLSAKQLSLKLQRSVSITADGRLVQDAAWLQQDKLQAEEPEAFACEQEFQHEVEQLTGTIKHHIPVAVLIRGHWAGVLLQFLLEACYGAAFYTFFTWVPAYMSKELHIPASNTLWALLIGLLLFAVTVPLAGHFIGDTKVPKVWALLSVSGVIAVAIMPVMVVIQTGSAVGLWLLLPVMVGLTGLIGGIMTTIGPQIYPAAVRASGYNLGHNLTMSLFGGLCPLIISALAVALQPATNAAGVVVVMTALLTFGAGVALVKAVPGTNVPCPAGQHVEYLEQQQKKHKEDTQMQQVVVPTV